MPQVITTSTTDDEFNSTIDLYAAAQKMHKVLPPHASAEFKALGGRHVGEVTPTGDRWRASDGERMIDCRSRAVALAYLFEWGYVVFSDLHNGDDEFTGGEGEWRNEQRPGITQG